MNPDMDPIVDAHLDLAANAGAGLDLTVDARTRRQREPHRPLRATVGLPDLRRGGIAVAFATLFCVPHRRGLGSGVSMPMDDDTMPAYRSPGEAEEIALSQLEQYRRWERDGLVRLVTTVSGLDRHIEQWEEDRIPGLVVLMEGADPIVEPADVPAWYERGVRLVGLSWSRTRYAGGTGAPGPVSAAGEELLGAMAEVGMALDLSHLADEGFPTALRYPGPICVTHAHPRALSDSDRQLPDRVLHALAERDSVVGVTMVADFLQRGCLQAGTLPTLAEHWSSHARYVADVLGWDRVGIGSDLDGGVGVDESPQEIDSVADVRKAGDVVPAEHRTGVLGANWLGWLRRTLPA
jgi:membrane dipeptidase